MCAYLEVGKCFFFSRKNVFRGVSIKVFLPVISYTGANGGNVYYEITLNDEPVEMFVSEPAVLDTAIVGRVVNSDIVYHQAV